MLIQTLNQTRIALEVLDLADANKERVIRVLHVDDDPSILEISKLILLDMGNFEIDNACCVDEAIKKLSNGKYDIAISDYEMPQKNGLDFLKELREQNNQIPFILFTGKGREEVAIKALNLGADGYHNKQGSPETVYGELVHSIKLVVERHKTKEELEEHETRFSKLTAQTPGMLFQFLKRPDGTFCVPFASDRIRDVFGCAPHDVKNDFSPIIKAIVPEDLERVICSIQQSAVHLSLWQCEYRVQLPGQKTRWMWGQSAPERLEDGSILWSGYNLDITDRKKTEEFLKESEEKFRNLAEESPNMIFINLHGRVVYVNKKCAVKLGYTKEEFYSPSFNFLSIIAPENVELLKSSYAKHMKGEDVSPYEYVLVSRSGRKIDAVINSKLIEYNGQIAILGLVTDISEQKKNETSLRQSEDQFRQLFSRMPSGVAIYEAVDDGEDFVFRDFNLAAEKIEKISKDTVLGKRLTQTFPGAKNFGIFEVFQRVWRTGQPEYYPATLYKDDKGSSSWRENWVYKLPNGNIIAIYNDISDRIETDTALWQEREKLESVTASIDAGLVIVSKEYNILWENEFIRRYKGNVNGKLCYSTLNTLDSPCHDCGVAKIFAGKNTSDVHEYCSTTVEGKPYWVEIIASPIKDENGKVIAASELAIDITKRKQVEQELQERDSKFRALFNANPEAAVFLDPDFHVIEANSRFCTLFGYSFDEIKGKIVTDLIVPDDSKEESRIVRQKIIQGQVEIVTRRKRKDGSQIPLSMSGGPVFVNEKLIGSVMVYKDFTDIITAEEELNKALNNAELLNEKLRVVGSLTRHDVRNKLSAVKGYAYLLKKKHNEQLDIVEGLSKMEQAVNESVKMFEFAKMYEQLGVEDLTYINVEDKINEASALLSGPLPKMNKDCHGLTVLADSFLRQMFYNFIDNTRKHGQKTTTIRVHYKKTDQDSLKLIYEDDGVGVSLENKSRLFNEGFSTGGSTGFGLFLTKKMIDIYGWDIEENGVPGKGAKFTMTIPKLNKNGKNNYQLTPM